MKSVKALAAALLFSGMFAGSASASSILVLGDTPPEAASSIITLGDPDPCADDACAEEAVASADPSADSNAALVDIYGMPTNMPVIMRPSMDTPDAPAATAAADPAATAPAAAPAPAQQQPVQQPAPVVETPKVEPAPAVEQPVNQDQGQQQPNGQPVER